MANLTPKSDVNLCLTCRHAFIRENFSGERTQFCNWIYEGFKIRGNTTYCNSYASKETPDVHDLEKIAWVITSDPKGKVGFRPLKEVEKETSPFHD